MPRKRTGYDAACYYDGKLLGRCTKADRRPPKPPAAQPRPKRPQGSFGPYWPEAAKEV